jgi:hypothetical protein
MNNVKIRYSRENNRTPKNTLATIESDGKIYFGIARCNSSDMFRKRVGRQVATTRALRASGKTLFEVHDSNLYLDETGLRGMVSVEYAKELIGYFRDIDSTELVLETETM